MQIEALYANDMQIHPESLSLVPWNQEITCLLCAVDQKEVVGLGGRDTVGGGARERQREERPESPG